MSSDLAASLRIARRVLGDEVHAGTHASTFLALRSSSSSRSPTPFRPRRPARTTGAGASRLCAPNPTGGSHFEFTANVSNGSLHGEHGSAGQPGRLTLDGNIRPDGGASLSANGITGQPQFNYAQTARGVPYDHPVTAHFEAQRGTGQRTKPRVCNFAFHEAIAAAR